MAHLHGHCTVSVCLLTALLMVLTGVQSAADAFNETLLGTVSTFINVSGIPSKHSSCSVLFVTVNCRAYIHIHLTSVTACVDVTLCCIADRSGDIA